jgi:alpha,alpha-trehalase
MIEKYNVVQQIEGGGGNYSLQDGFGWTNGVYLKFIFLNKI